MIYLAHHGIKGQKWGVRRYQNYDGSLTDAGKKRYNKSSTSDNGRDFVNDHSSSTYRGFETAVAIGIGAQFVSVAANIAINKIKLNREKREVVADYDEITSDPLFTKGNLECTNSSLNALSRTSSLKSFKDVNKLTKPMSAKKSMSVVNPGYPYGMTTQNCVLCTAAMIMREKGYDVKARRTAEGFEGTSMIKALFGVDIDPKDYYTSDTDALKKMAECGEGAYGILGTTWIKGGGHAMFWKVEKGKVHVYDGQCGKEYTRNRLSWMNNVSMGAATYRVCRVDNVEPTNKVLCLVENL